MALRGELGIGKSRKTVSRRRIGMTRSRHCTTRLDDDVRSVSRHREAGVRGIDGISIIIK